MTAHDAQALEAPEGLEVELLEAPEATLAVFTWAPPTVAPPARLSPAEAANLEAIAAGLSNAEIASRRGVSIRTVANQNASLFRKAGVQSRHELLARVRPAGGRR